MSKKAWDLVPTLKKVKDGEMQPNLFIQGIRCELTEDQKKKIEKLEEESKKYNLKVLTVIEGTYILGGTDHCHMVAYVTVARGEQPWIISDDQVGFMATVVNDTFDIEETGSVGIRENGVGMIFRTV